MKRSLQYVGCDRVLASSRPVSDAGTAKWMEHFYRRVQAVDEFADASRAASLENQWDLPAPFYWAPFVLLN